jgi:RHS repeat-associated protein
VAVILTDHLGSPIEVHDMSGALLWTWYSDAFGTTLPDEDPGHTGKRFTLNVRFPGQYYDAESGLHYNGQRYYAPTLGRYISSDPIGLAGGINTYAYVGGDPLRHSDSLGLDRDCGPGKKPDVNRICRPFPEDQNLAICVTGECSSGLKPTIPDNRSIAEIDQSGCEFVCTNLTGPTPLPFGYSLKILGEWGAHWSASYIGCKWICNKSSNACGYQ